MRQLVLEKIVISPFPPMNKRCLWIKGDTFNYWYKGAWRTIDTSIEIDGEDVDDIIAEAVATEVANVVGKAPAEYDTLEEIAKHIVEHKVESATMQGNITANTEAIEDLAGKIGTGGSGDSGDDEGWTEVN